MLTVKQINQTSISLGKSAGKLNDKIHAHAMIIIKHISEHGDVTLADVLCDALGSNNMRVNSLRQWFITYGGCSWNVEKKAFRKAKDFTFDFDQAQNTPFWKLMPEPEFKPVDGEALIKSVIAKMKKALDDQEHSADHKVNKSHLRALELILAGDFQFEDEVTETEGQSIEDQLNGEAA